MELSKQKSFAGYIFMAYIVFMFIKRTDLNCKCPGGRGRVKF